MAEPQHKFKSKLEFHEIVKKDPAKRDLLMQGREKFILLRVHKNRVPWWQDSFCTCVGTVCVCCLMRHLHS